jgi:AraC-like DNA-binding protein
MASLTLGWLHVIVLLGALQGIILAGALVARPRNRTANRLLAAAMLAFSISLASSVYHAAQLVAVYPHFFGLGYPLPFLFGPLIYLYARHATHREGRFEARHWLHFVPFSLVVLFGLPIYAMSGPDKVAFFSHIASGGRPPALLLIADPLKFVSGIAYAAATVVLLQRHRRVVKESYSSTEKVNLHWLLWLGGAAAAIWLIATAFAFLESAGVVRVGLGDDVVSLAVAILVYSIGYMGLRQPEIFRYDTSEFQAFPEVAPSGIAPGDPMPEPEPGPRYQRSGLTARDAARLRDALLAAMERGEPWRDSDLNLADLAERLDTTPHRLSEVLNSEIGQTFYDFVNGYRVREVQRRIAAGEARALKILSIALDAGFASKSTFNQVFKKHTNQTPSDFRQALGA